MNLQASFLYKLNIVHPWRNKNPEKETASSSNQQQKKNQCSPYNTGKNNYNKKIVGVK